MVSHPVFLYLGYVGLAVPFAFAVGALLSGRTDERWIVATRRWTIVAWTALGIGQRSARTGRIRSRLRRLLRLGPGRERRALMPWLAATAFTHSVMIQEKRGMLRVWNVTLVSLAFCLSLFGTFLTRSRCRQLDPLVHAERDRAVVPIEFIVVAVTFAVAMIWLRLPLLRTTARLESLVSREATFLLQPPPPRRAHRGDPLGHRVADRVRGGAWRGRGGRPAVLRLLPARSSACRCSS